MLLVILQMLASNKSKTSLGKGDTDCARFVLYASTFSHLW